MKNGIGSDVLVLVLPNGDEIREPVLSNYRANQRRAYLRARCTNEVSV